MSNPQSEAVQSSQRTPGIGGPIRPAPPPRLIMSTNASGSCHTDLASRDVGIAPTRLVNSVAILTSAAPCWQHGSIRLLKYGEIGVGTFLTRLPNRAGFLRGRGQCQRLTTACATSVMYWSENRPSLALVLPNVAICLSA
jgi:hypothetical protein